MNLLIPLDSNKRHEALLTTLDHSTDWAFIELEEGQIVECKFYKDRKDIEAWVEIWIGTLYFWHILIIDGSQHIIALM